MRSTAASLSCMQYRANACKTPTSKWQPAPAHFAEQPCRIIFPGSGLRLASLTANWGQPEDMIRVSKILVALLSTASFHAIGIQISTCTCDDDHNDIFVVNDESPEDEKRAAKNAVQNGSWPVVEAWVLKHGPDAPLSPGRTALSLAAEKGSIFIVRMLLAAHAHPQSCDHQSLSVLMYAAREGHTPVVHALLDAQASPEEPSDIFGNSPLHGAVAFGHTHAAVALLQAKCDPNLQTGDVRAPVEYGAKSLHETPLHLISRVRPPHLELRSRVLTSLLLEFDADPCIQDDRGDTPVHLLARKGDAPALWTMFWRLPCQMAHHVVHDLYNSQGESPCDEVLPGESSLAVRMALSWGPVLASVAHYIRPLVNMFRSDKNHPYEYVGEGSEDAAWRTYRTRLEHGSSLLPFEEGGDGVRRRRDTT